jgi:hypothetical protein
MRVINKVLVIDNIDSNQRGWNIELGKLGIDVLNALDLFEAEDFFRENYDRNHGSMTYEDAIKTIIVNARVQGQESRHLTREIRTLFPGPMIRLSFEGKDRDPSHGCDYVCYSFREALEQFLRLLRFATASRARQFPNTLNRTTQLASRQSRKLWTLAD